MYQKNKIKTLVDRARDIKEPMVLLNKEIDIVASALGVIFSDDFYDINTKFRFDNLYFDFFCFYLETCNQVVEETQKFRKTIHLPHRYVIISDMGDAGAIFIETQNSPKEPSPVIYCNEMDIDNLIEEKPLEYDHTIWPSFTDFFEYLVEQEEAAIQKETK